MVYSKNPKIVEPRLRLYHNRVPAYYGAAQPPSRGRARLPRLRRRVALHCQPVALGLQQRSGAPWPGERRRVPPARDGGLCVGPCLANSARPLVLRVLFMLLFLLLTSDMLCSRWSHSQHCAAPYPATLTPSIGVRVTGEAAVVEEVPASTRRGARQGDGTFSSIDRSLQPRRRSRNELAHEQTRTHNRRCQSNHASGGGTSPSPGQPHSIAPPTTLRHHSTASPLHRSAAPSTATSMLPPYPVTSSISITIFRSPSTQIPGAAA